MRHYFKRRHPSIFIKLILILVGAGFFINMIVGSYFSKTIQKSHKDVFRKNMENYVTMLIADLGQPPQKSRAMRLHKDLGISVAFLGPSGNWSTVEGIKPRDFSQKNFYERGHYDRDDEIKGAGYRARWRRGQIFVEIKRDYGVFYLVATMRKFVHLKKSDFVLMIVLVSIVIILAFALLRGLLRPVKALSRGVEAVAQGDLDHVVKVRPRDELGRLADSFNNMTARIKDMLESRKQLLLDVSHEIRTPLTRLKLGLEMLPGGELRQSLAEDVLEMEQMIAEILEGERLGSDNGSLRLKVTDLALLIQETRESLPDGPGRIVYQGPDALSLTVDPDRIRILLKNLLSNALKYSPADETPVEVQVSGGDDGKGVQIRVKDHGQGIPAEDLERIFEPFYRVDRSRSRESGGYGLGLSLCKKIVEAHGGEILVKSEPGQGTEIQVTLPARP